MRPLVYHYEKDETARECNDEFLVSLWSISLSSSVNFTSSGKGPWKLAGSFMSFQMPRTPRSSRNR